ncbi:MAG: CPBP family intramembrane metalloprotease [Burkholderiales bacterium]|nr:CPBP family intramembrane metalloprotease [Burkholderiales bacterium]
MISGLATTALFDGSAATKRLARSLVWFKTSASAHIIAVLVPIATAAGATLTFIATDVLPTPTLGVAGLFLAISIAGILPGLVGGPLGEELGWRGVLLPVLMERLTPLAAAIVLAPIWAAWHGPAFLMSEWRSGTPLSVFVPIYLVSVFGLSMLLTAVRIKSPNSLVPSILGHSAHNTAQGALAAPRLTEVISVQYAAQIGWSIASLLLVAGFAALAATSGSWKTSAAPAQVARD